MINPEGKVVFSCLL